LWNNSSRAWIFDDSTISHSCNCFDVPHLGHLAIGDIIILTSRVVCLTQSTGNASRAIVFRRFVAYRDKTHGEWRHCTRCNRMSRLRGDKGEKRWLLK
jgi:hypothetical protein